MRKIPFLLNLEKAQIDLLKKVANKKGVKVSELVRQILDKALWPYKPPAKP